MFGHLNHSYWWSIDYLYILSFSNLAYGWFYRQLFPCTFMKDRHLWVKVEKSSIAIEVTLNVLFILYILMYQGWTQSRLRFGSSHRWEYYLAWYHYEHTLWSVVFTLCLVVVSLFWVYQPSTNYPEYRIRYPWGSCPVSPWQWIKTHDIWWTQGIQIQCGPYPNQSI